MDIQGNNIIHTIEAYAKNAYGIDIKDVKVSEQLRKLNFSQTLELITALKNNDDAVINKYIDFKVEEMQSPGAVSNKVSAAQAREDGIVDDEEMNEVAGARNIKPTGRPIPKDPDDIQRNNNTTTSSDNTSDIEDNRSEIEKIKKLAGIR